MTFNNKVYNVLKWIALIALPACSTLIMALGDIWNIPCKNEIALTITAVDTFLGVLLGVSTASYKGEGALVVASGTDECVVQFNEENTLEEAKKEGMITLTVETVDELPPESPATDKA